MVYKTKPIKESLGGLEVSHLTFLKPCWVSALRFSEDAPLRASCGGRLDVINSYCSVTQCGNSMATTCNEMMRSAVFTDPLGREANVPPPHVAARRVPSRSCWVSLTPTVRGVLKPSASRRSIRTSIIVCRGLQRNRPALISLKTLL